MDTLILAYQIIFGGGVLIVILGFCGLDHLGEYIGIDTFTISSILTFLGGSGWVLSYFTSSVPTIVTMSLIITTFLSLLVHFFVVVPLRSTESSSLRSQKDMIRTYAEVISIVPADGYGEILVLSKLSSSNQIAKSATGEEILPGAKVIVTDIDNSGVFYVVPVDTLQKKYTLFG